VDTTWRRTINNAVEYAALPFGNLAFEIRATNRWGEKTLYPGRIIIINKPPFWKTAWFLAIIYVMSLFVLGVGFYLFYRNRQRKKEQVFLVNKKINDLEMMALRSQMNPHFIFNCLSSIQRYILKADILNANLYLHKFSTLIRKILHYSNTSAISLAEEMAILELYLSLEKLRIGDKMDFQIVVPEGLRPDNLYIPCMIIQPYVENAVKHGVSPLFNRKGMVTVRFERSAAYIDCFVEDNGPGIMASLANKSSDSPEYPSMGTSITENRIQAINSIQPDKIVLKIIDKSQLDPLTTGTIIQLSFPIITD
jgi:two-component sensor histidine kinase